MQSFTKLVVINGASLLVGKKESKHVDEASLCVKGKKTSKRERRIRWKKSDVHIAICYFRAVFLQQWPKKAQTGELTMGGRGAENSYLRCSSTIKKRKGGESRFPPSFLFSSLFARAANWEQSAVTLAQQLMWARVAIIGKTKKRVLATQRFSPCFRKQL